MASKYNHNEVELFKPYVHDAWLHWEYVKGQLWQCPSELWPAVMCEFVRACNEAFYNEQAPVKKGNASVRAGNIKLREIRKGLERNDSAVRDGLMAIMLVGPIRRCGTCKHWRNDHETCTSRCTVGNGSDGVEGCCSEWDSRV